jgi:NADPH-ferrihemoprotein reductase
MATISKIVDVSSWLGLESILHYTQNDDVAFLAFIILTGLFYSLVIKEKPDPYHNLWFEKPQSTNANTKEADTRDIGAKLEESVSRNPSESNYPLAKIFNRRKTS